MARFLFQKGLLKYFSSRNLEFGRQRWPNYSTRGNIPSHPLGNRDTTCRVTDLRSDHSDHKNGQVKAIFGGLVKNRFLVGTGQNRGFWSISGRGRGPNLASTARVLSGGWSELDSSVESRIGQNVPCTGTFWSPRLEKISRFSRGRFWLIARPKSRPRFWPGGQKSVDFWPGDIVFPGLVKMIIFDHFDPFLEIGQDPQMYRTRTHLGPWISKNESKMTHFWRISKTWVNPSFGKKLELGLQLGSVIGQVFGQK